MIFLAAIYAFTGVVSAQQTQSTWSLRKQNIFFVATSGPITNCDANTGGGLTSASGSLSGGEFTLAEKPKKNNWEGTPIYVSGLQAPYTIEQWAINVLKNLAIKAGVPEAQATTQEHIIALVAFATIEGGGVDGQLGKYNMLNTKIGDEDLKSAAVGTGVYDSESYASRDFPTFDIGIEAATRSLLSVYQWRTGEALLSPSVTAEEFMRRLTYYKEYPGNAAWATASIDGHFITTDRKTGQPVYGSSTKYLATVLSVVKNVRDNYAKYAGKIIDGSSSTGGEGTTTLQITNNTGCSAPAAQYTPEASLPPETNLEASGDLAPND